MQFKPMLGENFTNYPDSILDNTLWRISEKIDGVRRLFYKDSNNSITAWSRTNHEDKWLVHIFDYLQSPWFPSNTVYDCELVDRELYYKNVPSFVLRQKTNAKASQQYPENKQDLIAVCFDIFRPDGDMRSGIERDAELYSIFNRTTRWSPMVRVPIYGNIYGADMDTLTKHIDMVAARKGEGLMLLNMNSIYIPGRSKALLKVKQMKEFVGKVIDVELSKMGTKIEGLVGAVICEVPGCTVPVRVGSGFNNAERRDMVKNSPIGKYIEIDAFSYSKNMKGGVSLNLPIFKQFVNAR